MPGRTMNVFSVELMDALDALMDRVDTIRPCAASCVTSGKPAFLAGADLEMVRGYTVSARSLTAIRCSSCVGAWAASSCAWKRRQALGGRSQRHRHGGRPGAGHGLPGPPRSDDAAHPARPARSALGPAARCGRHAAPAPPGRLRSRLVAAAEWSIDEPAGSGRARRVQRLCRPTACWTRRARWRVDCRSFLTTLPSSSPHLAQADVPAHSPATRARAGPVSTASAMPTSATIRPTIPSSTACCAAHGNPAGSNGDRDVAVPAPDGGSGGGQHGAHAVPESPTRRARVGTAARAARRSMVVGPLSPAWRRGRRP